MQAGWPALWKGDALKPFEASAGRSGEPWGAGHVLGLSCGSLREGGLLPSLDLQDGGVVLPGHGGHGGPWGGGYPHLQAAFSGEQADSQAWGLLGLAMSGPHPQTHSAPGTPVLWAILGLKVPLGAQSGSSFWECCPQG